MRSRSPVAFESGFFLMPADDVMSEKEKWHCKRNKPNILFFHVDNISVGDFGCYGGAYPIGAKRRRRMSIGLPARVCC